jgi:N-acetyl-gamma-glutamyl-phosphate reductase
MTLQAPLAALAGNADVNAIYKEHYAESPFVRVVDGTPRLKDVVASNRALIGAAVDDRTVTAFCVIDNLVKGAAGGAVQWMNRLWSLPETAGLDAAAPAWT